MFKKRVKPEVVPASEYTDYSDRFEGDEKYATLRDVFLAASAPTLAVVGTGLFMVNKYNDAYSSTVIPVNAPIPVMEPVIAQIPSTLSTIPVNTIPQHTGIIADKSLEILATALDPVVQILVAISFPIASVIMVGACFFFMLGNSEKAWSMIMNAGLGYVLINLSPLFLQILKQIGEAI
ncbi:hypothetical protein [Lysinibacillus fusiformis]|uniref:hypothetical protein n=1 Tax=Lysinibacillus fusiformis TaxID=28031 RepID=UPI00088FA453|nr:hypothetical protein [Lysinibacillus fusiformis]SCX38308.1 hypothetical protein SAMN02787108_00266 [Lysinibacillus fusiformis]SDB05873.1 hypothetical protein SAMN02787070_00317 [Lysinibacillus fusiformis]SFH76094.1 hypothetical protein SAMN02787080_00316 [Lysinibacillus fusiformis]SFT29896.1 hypothetical protein SAMN02787099_04599 [Lysinibacillus fusiformis]